MKHSALTQTSKQDSQEETDQQIIQRLEKELYDERLLTQTLNTMLNLNDARYGAIVRKRLRSD